MANGLTPDDESVRELDAHFEAHVIEAIENEEDLYVAIHDEDPRKAAEQVDGIEYVGGNTDGAYFERVESDPIEEAIDRLNPHFRNGVIRTSEPGADLFVAKTDGEGFDYARGVAAATEGVEYVETSHVGPTFRLTQ